MKLYPHQRKAVEDLSNGKVLVGGVGSGKSLTALVYYIEKVLGGVVGDTSTLLSGRDLYVFTTARKRDEGDWQGDALRVGLRGLLGPPEGIVGVYPKVIVESYNNIQKYKDVKDAFIILDEQRMVGSGSWVKTFLKLAKHNEWIMLSATPGDKWEDYIPVFLANGFYKNRTEFKREHIIYDTHTKYPKVLRYIGTGRLLKHRNDILIPMIHKRHTTRHLIGVDVLYDQEMYKTVTKKRWNPYKEEPIKNVSELFYIMRKVCNSDQTRLLRVKEIMKKHPRLIIFYNFDYELEILRGLSDVRIVREWNGHKHEKVPDGDEWLYLVQYAAGAEAWNCVTTDAILFYSLTYSYRGFEQAQGRIDRLNTPYTDLYYYVLKSASSIDSAIFKAIREKRSFNEKNFVEKSAKNS